MTRPIKELFFKPKWQHKNEKIRSAAVAHSQDPRLINQLADIARQDEHESVRMSALKRLSDLYPVMRIASEDASERIRDQANKMLREMLAGQRNCQNTADERLEIIPKLDDREMIEYLVRHAVEPGIRLHLVTKVSRPGTLADLAMKDEEAEVREAAVSQIEKTSTLERIAAHARKHDKSLYRLIQHRLEHDSSSDTSQAYQDEHAMALCVEMEQLVRTASSRDQKTARLTELDQAWNELDLDPKSDLTIRFNGARRILESSLIERDDSSDSKDSAAENFLTELQRLLKHDMDLTTTERMISDLDRFEGQYPGLSHAHQSALQEARISLVNRRTHHLSEEQVNQSLLAICDRLENARKPVSKTYLSKQQEAWSSAWQSVASPTAADHSTHDRFRNLVQSVEADLEKRESVREERVSDIDSRMDRLEDALEEGNLATCVKLKQGILDDLALIGRHSHVNSTAFKSRLNAARGRLRELRDWQRWANNKVRESLIEEARNTAQTAMHPDAMARKVKQLQKQWRDMDLSERLPGEKNFNPARGALWEQFHQACNEAFEPAKAFFDKRSELRGEQESKLLRICEDLDRANSGTTELDVRAKERLIALARKSLREVAELQPSHRKKIAGKLRNGAKKLDDSLEEVYAVNQRKKEKLLEQLELARDGELEEAIELAKSLQSEWKKTGPARYKTDQKIWRRFRKVNDEIFNRRQADQAEQSSARNERKQQLFTVLDEMKAALDSSDTAEELAQQRSSFQRIWSEQGNEDKKLDRIFSQQLNEFSDKVARLNELQLKQRRVDLLDALAICMALESGDKDQEQLTRQWQSLGSDNLPESLLNRWQAACENSTQGDNTETALDIVMQIECLCSVDSPVAYSQQRMDYQVRRLSEHMSGEDKNSGDELDSLLDSLLAQIVPDSVLQADILSRARQAVEAYNEIAAVTRT